MNFDLSDEQRLLRDTVREFALAEVKPVAEELDRTKAFFQQVFFGRVAANPNVAFSGRVICIKDKSEND